MRTGTGDLLADRWELEEPLAVGGMGHVFRATDHARGEPVAVKVLPTTSAAELHRFTDEVESLRALDHPHVVRLLGAGEHRGEPFLVMELVTGRPLREVLEERTLTLAEARRLGGAVADALASAHEEGIVNRDVTPDNVLVDDDGGVKLADFGIALLEGSTRVTDTGVTIGSATYLAPEQITDEGIGPPADVYALGLVLLEAITGAPPFPGPLKEAAMARLSRDPAVPDDLPDPWARLLRLMTERDPGSRPGAAEVAGLLDTRAFDDEDGGAATS